MSNGVMALKALCKILYGSNLDVHQQRNDKKAVVHTHNGVLLSH